MPRNYWVYLGLSLIAPCYFGFISLNYALSHDYIIQDDARLHIVWLQRFIDPGLFPNDAIAEYYEAIEPPGCKFFYWLLAQIGIEPLLLAKILPLVLALITTIYIFNFTLQIFPVPLSGFLATLILNQNIWLKDDLISATPRAFVYPLLAAFLYYLSGKKYFLCLVIIALQGLIYPQMMLVELATMILSLFIWKKNWFNLNQHHQHYFFSLAGIALVLITIIPFSAAITQEFGSMVTAAQMKMMPEFGLHGRREYFEVNFLSFYFAGASGLRAPLYPPIIWLSIGLPLLLKYQPKLSRLITKKANILAYLIFTSISLFLLAHLLFTKLYLPSRYTFYSLRLVMGIASGIVLSILFSLAWSWLLSNNNQFKIQSLYKLKTSLKSKIILGLFGSFLAVTLIVPAIPALFLDCQSWVIGEAPEIYEFLRKQPKDTLIASLAQEANNIPAFAHRSILVSEEFALPYHLAFYNNFKEKTIELIHSQYSLDLRENKRIIDKYGIDFWLIESNAFKPDYLSQQSWLINSSFQTEVKEAIARLQQGQIPELFKLVNVCSSVANGNLILLDANCVIQAKVSEEFK